METASPSPKRLGYWISAKKSKKLSLSDIEDALRDRNIEPVRIDLDSPLHGQGEFDGFLHKLTDVIAKADQGDLGARTLLSNFETYVSDHPNIAVIDSIQAVRTVSDRYKTYSLIQNLDFDTKESVFVPPFVMLESNQCDKASLMSSARVQFPVGNKPSFDPSYEYGFLMDFRICKPILAHGCSAHDMTLVFNERGFAQCEFPCVVQSFVNHNGCLYKMFAIGEESYMVQRPSIINLFPSEDLEPIHFHSDEISKPEASCQLTIQGPDELEAALEPCPDVLKSIAIGVHRKLEVGLFGVDVVLEHGTGRYAIIDINVFPGYDGVSNFADRIASYVRKELDKGEPHPVAITKKLDAVPGPIVY